jgi:hypothetical protein
VEAERTLVVRIDRRSRVVSIQVLARRIRTEPSATTPRSGGTGGYAFNLSTKGLGPGPHTFRFRAGTDAKLYEITITLR